VPGALPTTLESIPLFQGKIDGVDHHSTHAWRAWRRRRCTLMSICQCLTRHPVTYLFAFEGFTPHHNGIAGPGSLSRFGF
jgi:hypothetical protein